MIRIMVGKGVVVVDEKVKDECVACAETCL